MTTLEQDAPPPPPTPTPPPLDPIVDFAAGTVAGVASLLTGSPFDVIKVRLQCQPSTSFTPNSVALKSGGSGGSSLSGGARVYRNSVHALLSIIKEENVAGLYKGVMSPMLGVAAINSSVFGFYNLFLSLQLPASPSAHPTLNQITLAGSASGVLTSFLTTPIERLKILQQSSPSLVQPSLISLVRSHSIPSLYRGLTPTILRDLAYGPYFATYEYVCRWGIDEPVHEYERDLRKEEEREVREVGTTRVLVAGGAAGIVGWGSTFALDVVKTRMQASEPYSRVEESLKPIGHPYRTTYSTIVNSYGQEGWRVFFRGLGPTLLRSIPVNMVCFFVFEACVDAFGGRR